MVGYDRAPRSLAAKVLGCFWMVFVTLTIVTYISSYVNHMFWASTLHKHVGDPNVSPIRDLIDLVNHKDGYTYGCVRYVPVPVFSSRSPLFISCPPFFSSQPSFTSCRPIFSSRQPTLLRDHPLPARPFRFPPAPLLMYLFPLSPY